MSHDYDAQRAETFETFESFGKEPGLPSTAVVDFQFYPEEIDADWDGVEAALRAKGFTTRRDIEDETVEASIGPIAVNAETIWRYERIATEVALTFDFYPDGWGMLTDE